MARATVSDVREILSTALTDPEVAAWIDIASAVIDSYSLQCKKAGTSLLLIMEKLLAAHYISATVDRSGSVTQRSIGDASETYMSMSGEGIKATTYGQQLLMLDPCGVLVDMGKRRAKSVLL